MAVKLRKLNQEGIDRFEDYVLSGAEGEPPMALLNDPTTSQPIQGQNIEMGSGLFDNRFDFGIHLNSLLRKHEPATFSRDQGFWSAMALVWFDRLCPQAVSLYFELRLSPLLPSSGAHTLATGSRPWRKCPLFANL